METQTGKMNCFQKLELLNEKLKQLAVALQDMNTNFYKQGLVQQEKRAP